MKSQKKFTVITITISVFVHRNRNRIHGDIIYIKKVPLMSKYSTPTYVYFLNVLQCDVIAPVGPLVSNVEMPPQG